MSFPPEQTHRLTSSQTGTFYFAFGSNLSAQQMSLRLSNDPSSSVPVCLARLEGYRWIICERGYANVVPVPPTQPSTPTTTMNGETETEDESVVWGIIYNMSPTDEARLDQYEGHDHSRNPFPTPNPVVDERVRKPYLQGAWDYNKLYLPLAITKWFRDPREYLPPTTQTYDVVKALVYVDEERVTPGRINEEYIGRMNRAIEEAVVLGLPAGWVERVMRRWVVRGVGVEVGYVGDERGYVEGERGEGRGDMGRGRGYLG